MAIGVIATLRVQEGKGAELETVFADLAGQVRANEPGNKLYRLCRSRGDANTYVVMELYDDQAAIEAHGKSDHFRAAGPKIGACLAGRPDIQYLDAV
ncbi:MAG: antibiotic biosynthesis monooxygenase [Alphaproteobacteria bacterium]|nr:antibiotic biosynthesis monooxygenase [Alphaproteobacteria bacterium]